MGDDQEHTRQILADLINHPNAGGVLVLGLGCENSNIGELKKYIGSYDENRVKFLVAQESDDEIEDALKRIQELVDYAAPLKREPISCKELIIGMKCGGLTASPASHPIQLSVHSLIFCFQRRHHHSYGSTRNVRC